MKRTDRIIENKTFFRCPVCRGKLDSAGESSLRCKKKHSFDLAAKGYVNLLSGQGLHQNKYDKELFECRNKIFSAGFYEPVLEEILKTMLEYVPAAETPEKTVKEPSEREGRPETAPAALSGEAEEGFSVLDVGCGEGFYASWLSRHCGRANVFGLDIVKEAIQIACRDKGGVTWMVGNLANIPLYNGTFDVLLNVLTPANYKEFCRILKKDGVLIKVVPGSDYLKEIRQCVSEQLKNKDYSNDSTVEYFKENMRFLERREVQYTLPVSPEQARLFLRMTPMTFHIDTEDLPEEKVDEIKEITIHLELLIGRKGNPPEPVLNR